MVWYTGVISCLSLYFQSESGLTLLVQHLCVCVVLPCYSQCISTAFYDPAESHGTSNADLLLAILVVLLLQPLLHANKKNSMKTEDRERADRLEADGGRKLAG